MILRQEIKHAKERAERGECDGACKEHRGDVRVCSVRNPKSGMEWGYFSYCEEAEEEDAARGLEVIVLDEALK